jgi:ABC-2 type transport system ATP-binding protein
VATADLPPAITAALTGTADGRVQARASSPPPLLGVLAAWAQARGTDLPDLQVARPTIEEIYLQLTRESR